MDQIISVQQSDLGEDGVTSTIFSDLLATKVRKSLVLPCKWKSDSELIVTFPLIEDTDNEFLSNLGYLEIKGQTGEPKFRWFVNMGEDQNGQHSITVLQKHSILG